MAPVVPKLYLAMGWKYDKRPPSPYRAPGGSMTFAGSRGVPCGADREIMLYVAHIAHEVGPEQARVHGSIQELRRWMGANRRIDVTREHLRRVLDCTIMYAHARGGYDEVRIGALLMLQGDHFEIAIGRMFHEQCLQGAPYDIATAARYRRQPATLDLYLLLTIVVRSLRSYPEFTHEFDPYAMLPQPASARRARQALRKRLAALRGAIPGVHLALAATGTGILIDIGEAPRRTLYTGASRISWTQRAEFARSVRRMEPAKRRDLGHTVEKFGEIEKHLEEARPLDELWATVRRAGEQTAEAFQTIEQYAARLRALKKGET